MRQKRKTYNSLYLVLAVRDYEPCNRKNDPVAFENNVRLSCGNRDDRYGYHHRCAYFMDTVFQKHPYGTHCICAGL